MISYSVTVKSSAACLSRDAFLAALDARLVATVFAGAFFCFFFVTVGAALGAVFSPKRQHGRMHRQSHGGLARRLESLAATSVFTLTCICRLTFSRFRAIDDMVFATRCSGWALCGTSVAAPVRKAFGESTSWRDTAQLPVRSKRSTWSHSAGEKR